MIEESFKIGIAEAKDVVPEAFHMGQYVYMRCKTTLLDKDGKTLNVIE